MEELRKIPENIEVNGKNFSVKKLLGKGKGGYSYLAEKDGKKYTLKQIHHEPCDYFQFGNKIEAESRDYQRLLEVGINIPKLYEIDFEKEIDGTVYSVKTFFNPDAKESIQEKMIRILGLKEQDVEKLSESD